jgi:hypothetical protein
MTELATTATALLAALAAATAGVVGADSGTPAPPRTALVIDSSAGRDGRELVDARLRSLDADVRLPRTAAEARTNVRYFAELGHRVIVAGPRSIAAAGATGVEAERAAGLGAALRAVSERR